MASVSLDLDNLWSYMKTHGDPGWDDYPTYLPMLVPRVLDFFGSRNLCVTFFFVGLDADRLENQAALASIAAAGHEIGNHSYRHEPWLHRYTLDELEEEITRAELAIESVTGHCPTGFRGPGYSLSPDTLRVLIRHGYDYDCSTLPTVIGPLARAYYFRTAQLTSDQRAERRELFGRFRDGLRPLKPYLWQIDGQTLVELPVTTMPFLRLPIHPSYLAYLSTFSPAAADLYFRAALEMCIRTHTDVSILLHPLDFLGPDDSSGLGFFPAMGSDLTRKLKTLDNVFRRLAQHFEITTISKHVAAIRTTVQSRVVDGLSSTSAPIASAS